MSILIYRKISNLSTPFLQSCGPFAIEKRETAKKIFFELIVILNIFQLKNHIWHININFIFLAVSPLSIAKGPYYRPESLYQNTKGFWDACKKARYSFAFTDV